MDGEVLISGLTTHVKDKLVNGTSSGAGYCFKHTRGATALPKPKLAHSPRTETFKKLAANCSLEVAFADQLVWDT